ncbi:putative Pentatricopeptide repeat-containing protein [Zostera marina]|uniref:Putative Pentatricopeptide repeat-containing protein n=1 Tax=Zostera marina TaxID=29655 RepID=A0A0K9PLV7_ZOSMR|nr:putative Pentatricopeptide repeat-containing protein [Zostera marina]
MEEKYLLSLLKSTALRPDRIREIHTVVVRIYPNLTPLLVRYLQNPTTISYALQMFDTIPKPDSILTNSIVATCSKLSLYSEALEVFFSSHRRGTQLAFFSIPPVIKACALFSAFHEGKQLHSHIVRSGFWSNSFILTAMIDFYSKNEDLSSARKVFEEVPVKDPVTYNCLISGYSKAGDVLAARQLFDEMTEKSLVTWNSMISCYAHSDNVMEGLILFQRMQLEKVEANEITLVTILSMCARLGDLEMGLKIKKLIDGNEKMGGLIVRTAVLEMLVKGGSVDEARLEFDEMDHRDIVAWTAMISGYAQNGRPKDALDLFEKMKLETRVKPNKITLTCVLSACGQLGSVETGERIGRYVEEHTSTQNIYIGSALVDMYSKCGNIRKARKVFDEMPYKDIVSWNSMIRGLAYNGLANEAIDLYRTMVERELEVPTELTFIALLTACTHAGLVELGLQFYNSMKVKYNMNPKVEHSACIVDLLCKCGRLEDAYMFIHEMDVEPNVIIWGTLLSACRVDSSHVELAEVAMEKLQAMEPDNSANYVLMANIYGSAGRWREAVKMRRLMKDKHVTKCTAYSWIELDNIIHKFMVRDTSHPNSTEIYSTVNLISSAADLVRR